MGRGTKDRRRKIKIEIRRRIRETNVPEAATRRPKIQALQAEDTKGKSGGQAKEGMEIWEGMVRSPSLVLGGGGVGGRKKAGPGRGSDVGGIGY